MKITEHIISKTVSIGVLSVIKAAELAQAIREILEKDDEQNEIVYFDPETKRRKSFKS